MLKLAGRKLDGSRWFTESAERNKNPILGALQRVMPATGLVLEIASGTGQHVVYFAQELTELEWQPSDPDPELRASIRAWMDNEQPGNVRAPLDLDVSRLPWPIPRADAVLCINMIHVASWAAAQALFAGANQVLEDGGILFLYGPYRRFGRHTAPSNEAFDTSLRATDATWGLRDLEAVIDLASAAGFELAEVTDMPANNLSVVFRRKQES